MSPIIPEEFIEQLKESADIRSVVSEFVPLRRSGRNWMGLCPFHEDKDPSFSINEERQTYYCFGCGEGGDVIKFLMKIRGLSFVDAVKHLAQRFGMEIPQRPLSPAKQRRRELEERLIAVNTAAEEFYHQQLLHSPEASAARDYLHGRGITRETIKRFRLGWAPEGWDALKKHLTDKGFDPEVAEEAGLLIKRERSGGWYDRFRGRIIFPIADRFGRTVALGGRVLDDQIPKYLNSPESMIYKKARVLYGFYLAKDAVRRARRGFIVEGYMDLISLVQAGLKEVVATLGTALTEHHARALKGLCRDWYLVFDGDAAGLRAAKRAVPIFYAYDLRPKVIVLPSGHDPDSLVRQEGLGRWEELADTAVPGLEFLVSKSMEEFGEEGEGRHQAAREVLKLLEQVADPIRKSLLLSRAAEALALPERSLWDALERNRGKTARLIGATPNLEAGPGKAASGPKKDEAFVMGFLLNHPTYIPRFMETNMEVWLEDQGARRLWDFLRNTALTYEDPATGLAQGLAELDDETLALANRMKTKCPPCEDSEAAALGLLEFCRRRHARWLKQELIRRMKEGEDGEEVRLLQEIQQLLG